MFQKYKIARSAISTILIVAGLCLLFVLSLAFGASAMGFMKEGEISPFSDGGIGSLPEGSKGCYLKDEAFTNIGSIPNSQTVFDRIGLKYPALNNDRNKNNLDKIITESISNSINPAILLSFYNGEQSMKGTNDYKAFGCGDYNKGGNDSGFDKQISCALPLIKKAINKEPVYNTPEGQNAWTRLLYHYVAAAKKNSFERYGYVSDSKDPRIILLNDLIPDQVVCDSSPLDGKNLYKDLDQVKAYFGSTPEEIKNHLTTTQFMGQTITVNKVMVPDLKKVESQIKKSSYKVNDIGAYNFRANVNDSSDLSAHAFGLAIDINSSTNPNMERPANSKERDPAACKHDIPDQVAKAFEDNNFFWGAKFKDVCDSMHFQYGGNWQ